MLWRRFVISRVTAVALLAIGGAAIAGACTDDGAANATNVDPGVDTVITTGVCPLGPPDSGATCVLPEGTTCAFACGSSIARCSLGLWRYAGNPPPHPPCPEPEPPPPNSPCPACWPAAAVCLYGSQDCSSPDASTNRALATCPDGRWKIEFSPCATPAQDAGADVQGDADADVE